MRNSYIFHYVNIQHAQIPREVPEMQLWSTRAECVHKGSLGNGLSFSFSFFGWHNYTFLLYIN